MRGAGGVAGSSVVCSERPERGGAARAALRLHAQKGKERSASTGNSKRGMEITKGSGINAEAKTTILDYRLHLLDRETV